MAFLKKKTAKGRNYYSIAESYRDGNENPKQRIIKNIGNAQNALDYLCSDNFLKVEMYRKHVQFILCNEAVCEKCGKNPDFISLYFHSSYYFDCECDNNRHWADYLSNHIDFSVYNIAWIDVYKDKSIAYARALFDQLGHAPCFMKKQQLKVVTTKGEQLHEIS